MRRSFWLGFERVDKKLIMGGGDFNGLEWSVGACHHTLYQRV